MKKVLPAAALLLTACQPNPDSSECETAFFVYLAASNNAALKLAEMDAIDACGERGFLKKQSEHAEQYRNIILENSHQSLEDDK
jgi:hypothetical protein